MFESRIDLFSGAMVTVARRAVSAADSPSPLSEIGRPTSRRKRSKAAGRSRATASIERPSVGTPIAPATRAWRAGSASAFQSSAARRQSPTARP